VPPKPEIFGSSCSGAGGPLAVQRAIPHFIGEIPTRTLEAELVKSANSASSNAITQAAMGISLDQWVDQYSQTTD